MDHQVKLTLAEFVKAFNIRSGSDPAYARTIWLAVQQPGKPVAIKNENAAGRAGAIPDARAACEIRTMQSNVLRGRLTAYGKVMGNRQTALDKAMPEVLTRVRERLPAALIYKMREQRNGLVAHDEREFSAWSGLVLRQTGRAARQICTASARWATTN